MLAKVLRRTLISHEPRAKQRPMVTLLERFLETSRATPERDALRIVDSAGPKRRAAAVSYRALEARAKALGEALLVKRLEPGTRVAILARPREQWVALDLACQMAGLISVPLFPKDAAPAHQRILQASDASIAIAEDPWQAKKLVDAAPGLEVVLIDAALTTASGARMSASELGMSGLETLADLEARRGAREAGELVERMSQVEADAVVSLAYTPGTEGQQKGVMLTHGNLAAVAMAAAKALREIMDGPPPDGGKAAPGEAARPPAQAAKPAKPAKKDDEVQLLTLPLAQTLGRTALWTGLLGGVPTAIPRSDATLFEDAALFKPTHLIGVPSFFLHARSEALREVKDGGGVGGLFARWVGAPAPGPEASIFERLGNEAGLRLLRQKLQKMLGGRVRFVVAAGAPLPDGLAGFFARHGIALREGYGMVETCALSHLDRGFPPTPGSGGTPLDGFSHRLGLDGELFVSGPGLTPGYWRDAEETRKAFLSEPGAEGPATPSHRQGAFATGDLAREDDGHIVITGRKRDIIVMSDGRTVAPRPIEDALCLGDSAGIVAQVLVYGEQRAFVTALVALDAEALARFAGQHGLGPGDFDSWSRHAKVYAHLEALVAKVNATQPAHAAVKKFAVLPSALTTEAGELTPSLTLRRGAAADKFKSLLDSFYAETF